MSESADERIKAAVEAHVEDTEAHEPSTVVAGGGLITCSSTYKGERCVEYPGHDAAGDTDHKDAAGNTWPTHRPWSPSNGYGDA